MPSIRKRTTKDGRDYYEITVSRGRSLPRLFSRWYVPEGWSQRTIDRELAKVAAEFERQCKAGEVVSRREKRQQEAQEAAEAAKIQTVRQYAERVFMPAKAVTMSENSRASFQSALNTWIYPAIGNTKLPDVSPADLSALLLEIQAKGRAHSTAVKVYTVLHTLFKMAYLADEIPRNPMDKVARPVPRKDEVILWTYRKHCRSIFESTIRLLYPLTVGSRLRHLAIDNHTQITILRQFTTPKTRRSQPGMQ